MQFRSLHFGGSSEAAGDSASCGIELADPPQSAPQPQQLPARLGRAINALVLLAERDPEEPELEANPFR